jgi:hypothetical protein
VNYGIEWRISSKDVSPGGILAAGGATALFRAG